MRDCQHADDRWRFEIDDVVGKRFTGARRTCRSTGTRRTSEPALGQAGNLLDRGIDRLEEVDAQAHTTLFVPTSGGAIFGSARPRSERASSPLAQFSLGPPSHVFLRDALGLAAQHAARTSFDFGCPGRPDSSVATSSSSRLARSWAATSARSSTGSARASRRRSCVRCVMWAF